MSKSSGDAGAVVAEAIGAREKRVPTGLGENVECWTRSQEAEKDGELSRRSDLVGDGSGHLLGARVDAPALSVGRLAPEGRMRTRSRSCLGVRLHRDRVSYSRK